MKTLFISLFTIAILVCFSFEPNITTGSKNNSLKIKENATQEKGQVSNSISLLTSVTVTPVVIFDDCDKDCPAKSCPNLWIYVYDNGTYIENAWYDYTKCQFTLGSFHTNDVGHVISIVIVDQGSCSSFNPGPWNQYVPTGGGTMTFHVTIC